MSSYRPDAPPEPAKTPPPPSHTDMARARAEEGYAVGVVGGAAQTPTWTLKETLEHFDDWIAHAKGEDSAQVSVPVWAAERVIRALREALAKS